MKTSSTGKVVLLWKERIEQLSGVTHGVDGGCGLRVAVLSTSRSSRILNRTVTNRNYCGSRLLSLPLL